MQEVMSTKRYNRYLYISSLLIIPYFFFFFFFHLLLKAYLEFFASPEFVKILLKVIELYPLVNYHIVNRKVNRCLYNCLLRLITMDV